ncbi:TolC family protein [Flammeovirga sp. SJP92]|uniref:TolC family protein n=1 Tax=Flammeovirga sp. SJP92 TaxID=1775430 RepID=UPI000787557D|nr:TolC family protein [Flammeovirga sp. SJP92]KXX68946.1 hypothetical protein AVL50_17450 [Flammeovirga sp. SJP92]
MKRILILLLFGFSYQLLGQTTITFKQAEQEALEKHPISQQREMFERIHANEVESIQKNKLPQFNLQGQVGYFSDVVAPTDPEVAQIGLFPEIPKTQWQTYASVDYLLYDGAIKKKRLADKDADFNIKLQENEVSQFKIKESVSQIYFAALSYQEQELLIKEGVIKEIENQLKEIETLEKGGVVLPNTTDALRVEYHKAKQKLLSIQAQKKGALRVLGIWLERENEWNEFVLVRPTILNQNSTAINRPELKMYQLQSSKMDRSKDLLQTERMPKISLYALGGYGNPNPYNFFEINGDTFYQFGVRVKWSPFDYGKNKKERQITQIQKEVIDSELETFNKSLNIQISQIQSRIDQLNSLILEDHEIIKIHERKTKRSKGALDNGAVTSSEYISSLNAMVDAKLNLSNHELELLQTQYHLAMTKGLL